MKSSHFQEIIRELEVLEQLNHPNIIQFIDMYVDSQLFYIITDAQHMNMREYVNSFYHRLTEKEVKKLFK